MRQWPSVDIDLFIQWLLGYKGGDSRNTLGNGLKMAPQESSKVGIDLWVYQLVSNRLKPQG